MAQVMKRICHDKSLGLSIHVAMDSGTALLIVNAFYINFEKLTPKSRLEKGRPWWNFAKVRGPCTSYYPPTTGPRHCKFSLYQLPKAVHISLRMCWYYGWQTESGEKSKSIQLFYSLLRHIILLACKKLMTQRGCCIWTRIQRKIIILKISTNQFTLIKCAGWRPTESIPL